MQYFKNIQALITTNVISEEIMTAGDVPSPAVLSLISVMVPSRHANFGPSLSLPR
jgi:hypothetical protein